MKKANYTQVNSSSIWILLVGVTATTSYFQTKYLDPFNTAKLIIILITAGWLLGHIINSFRIHTRESNLAYLKINAIPLFFIFAMMLSLFYSDKFVVALIGESQRRNGFLAYLALLIIFLFSARFINVNYAKRMIKVTVWLGSALSLYGVLQVNGRDFVTWDNPYNSMLITLGNPNFASSLLAIFSIISILVILMKDFGSIYKIVSLISLAMSIYSIVNSQSRQGLLVLAFGIVFYISLHAYTYNWQQRYLIYILSSIGALSAVFGMLQMGPLASLLYKDSVSVRGFYWRAGIEMFLDHPLTGIGLDNYGSFFKEYRESEYPLRYGFTLTSSNAHNTFIQFFSTGGLFVGLSYFLLVAGIYFAGVKLLRNINSEDKKIVLILLSAWVGFQAQSLISIDNIGISVWGWLLGGSIIGISYTNRYQNNVAYVSVKHKNSVNISIFQPALSVIFVIVFGLISVQMHQVEYKSYQIRGLVSSQDVQVKELYTKYANEVINNDLADPSYKFLAARALINAGLFEQSYAEIKKLYSSDKRNLDYLQWLAEYERSRNDTLLEIKYREEIYRYDPWNAENLYRLGNLHKDNGNLIEARKMLEKIISFAKNTEIGKLASESLAENG